ncbi:hypothetical protein CBS147353_11000 [Aspergillus niger]|nr:hypothetical protein CBS147353_11000 [Aspergillus niger]
MKESNAQRPLPLPLSLSPSSTFSSTQPDFFSPILLTISLRNFGAYRPALGLISHRFSTVFFFAFPSIYQLNPSGFSVV